MQPATPRAWRILGRKGKQYAEANEAAKARAPGRVEELHRADFEHLELGHWPAVASSADQHLLAAARGGSLPYDVLDSHAFERLCFHLLLAKSGGPARFWGRRGQAQQGIDLILSNGVANAVYQCKRAASFNAADLSHAAHKFRDTWLKQAGLGKPDKFVLCTSASLTDTTAWEASKRELAAEIGIAIEEWHRDTLSAWLRQEPGIVAELFGDQVAEAFCGRAVAGNAGIFRPMLRGQEPRVDRYLDLLAARRLVRFEQDRQTFARCLGEHQTVLLGGQAGAGKTMSALDLAAGFEGGSWRVFYLRANASDDLDRLVSAMLAYAFRPTIFVVDDCQQAFDDIERLVYRLGGADRSLKLVLTARTPPAASDAIEPNGTSFVEALREQGQVMDLVVDDARFSAVVTARAPGWAGKRLAKLMAWSGRDLTTLDLLLDVVGSKDVDDVRNLNDLLPRICTHLFGAKAVSAFQLKRLAAVAQFDVPVPAVLFPDPLEQVRNAKAVTRLVLASGQPRSLAFHHASAAELLFQVLAWANGEGDSVAACAQDCVEVLHLASQRLGGQAALYSLLLPILLTQLSLSDDSDIKRRILANPLVLTLVTDHSCYVKHRHLKLLSLAAFLCRGTSLASPYAALLSREIEEDVRECSTPRGVGMLPMFLRSLWLADSVAGRNLEQRLGGAVMARLIGECGTLVNLLRILAQSSDVFAADLLQAFKPAQLDSLVQRTLDNEASIGTLPLALRELGTRPLPDDTGRTQLNLFEQQVGGAAMARLIGACGTLVDLLRILAQSSDVFAVELLQAFQPAQMDSLVHRSLDNKTSIGTLNLELLELAKRPLAEGSRRTQLNLFEERLGATRFWTLISSQGNLHHLTRIVAALSPKFRLTAFSPPFNPDQASWEALARKGSLYSLGQFAADGLPLLPGAVSQQLERVAASTGLDLAANSTWGEIAAAINQVERLPASHPVGAHVTAAAQQRWQSVDLDAIDGLDFQAATEALSVLWRKRGDLQPELGARLWRILPHETAWPNSYKLLLQARFPLAIARSQHVSDSDALRLLRAFSPLSPAASLSPKSARYHALFLWSLYALWFDRGQRSAPGFEALQTPETWQRLVAVVKQRLPWRGNAHKLETLMLAGALVYLVPGLRPQLDFLVRAQIKGAAYLMKEIDSDMTFLPAVLICHGMALHLSKSAVFSPKRIDSLLPKAADYPEQGAALRQLCATLR